MWCKCLIDNVFLLSYQLTHARTQHCTDAKNNNNKTKQTVIDNTIIKCPLIWKQYEGNNNKFQKTEVINNHDLKITVNVQNLVDLKRKQSEECLNKFLEINNNGCKYCPYVNKCSELLDNCNITLCGYIENILK